MCFLTEQEVRRDGEDESKIWNVTDWKNEYILKIKQPGVGMVLMQNMVSSVLQTLEDKPDVHMESCTRQMEKKL